MQYTVLQKHSERDFADSCSSLFHERPSEHAKKRLDFCHMRDTPTTHKCYNIAELHRLRAIQHLRTPRGRVKDAAIVNCCRRALKGDTQHEHAALFTEFVAFLRNMNTKITAVVPKPLCSSHPPTPNTSDLDTKSVLHTIESIENLGSRQETVIMGFPVAVKKSSWLGDFFQFGGEKVQLGNYAAPNWKKRKLHNVR